MKPLIYNLDARNHNCFKKFKVPNILKYQIEMRNIYRLSSDKNTFKSKLLIENNDITLKTSIEKKLTVLKYTYSKFKSLIVEHI